MISEKNRTRAENAKREIAASGIDPVLKEVIEDIIDDSLSNTNGISYEQKLQACCDGQLMISILVGKLFVRLDTMKDIGWKRVVVETKWQIVLMAAVAAVLLCLRPELGALVQSLVP